jgi:hypothetical protein
MNSKNSSKAAIQEIAGVTYEKRTGANIMLNKYYLNDTFYNIFHYCNVMDDAIDGLTWEIVTLEKDLIFPGGKIPKGTEYETVYFIWADSQFQFINWERIPNGDGFETVPDPNKSVAIPLSEMAPYIKW